MPSFYNTTTSQRMPPTPPDTYGRFASRDVVCGQLPSMLFNHKTSEPCCRARGHEDFVTNKQHLQCPSATASRPTNYSNPNGSMAQTYSAPTLSSSNQYGPISAPLLPPIRVSERSSDGYSRQLQHQRTSTAPQAKEEKIGGVAAHLDYDMEEMIEFVSEMATGMYEIYASKICLADIDITRSVLNSKSSPHRDYRKYVSQVLSSTRLPSSTILLGLLYLSKRMTLLSNKGRYGHSTRDIYTMLTTALVLGSKFLDDNTFQNKSWSEVSNIPVSDLNFLEIQWLVDIKWDMHIDQKDPQGFQLWLDHWERFQSRKLDLSLAESMKQAHIQSSGQQTPQQRSMPQLPPLSMNRSGSQSGRNPGASFVGQTPGPWNNIHLAQWQQPRSQINFSPPSAPETGPNTPNAYDLLHPYAYVPPNVCPPIKLPPTLPSLPSNVAHSTYPSHFMFQYSHGNYCDCTFCNVHHERYLMVPGYASQPVVG